MEMDAAREGVMAWPADKLLLLGLVCPHSDTQSWISCVVYVIAAMEERLFSEMAMALLVTLFKNSMREGEGAYCRYATLSLHVAAFTTVGLVWSVKILAVK